MKSLLIAVAVLSTAPAFAATESFTVGGTTISFPVPAGYCRPQGPAVALYETLAKADTQNITHLDLVPCTARTVAGFDHIGVKTPVNVASVKLPRGQLLTELKPQFDKPEFRAAITKNMEAVNGKLATDMGTKVDFGGDFGPRGIDKDCAYVGGSLLVSGTDGTKAPPQGAAACMSTVGEKFVSVNFYSADPSGASIQRLMQRARNLMLSMTAK